MRKSLSCSTTVLTLPFLAVRVESDPSIPVYEISCLWGTDAIDLAKAIEALAKADAQVPKAKSSPCLSSSIHL